MRLINETGDLISCFSLTYLSNLTNVGILLFLKQIIQKIINVHFQVIIETFQASMASEGHAVGNRFLLNLNHVSDLRSFKVVAFKEHRFY